MLSLDYIEKLTGIKEDWIQNLKETVSALVLAVQLSPQEHICPHCKATTRRIKGCYTRLIKHSPLLHKMKSIFRVPVTFPACFPSMNVKEMPGVRSTKSSSLTLKTSVYWTFFRHEPHRLCSSISINSQ